MKMANLAAKFWRRLLVKLNGEFFAKFFVPASFCLAKKLGEINPWSQSYQTFFINRIYFTFFEIELGHFRLNALFSYVTNTHAK
jgi:hypothetical protein